MAILCRYDVHGLTCWCCAYPKSNTSRTIDLTIPSANQPHVVQSDGQVRDLRREILSHTAVWQGRGLWACLDIWTIFIPGNQDIVSILMTIAREIISLDNVLLSKWTFWNYSSLSNAFTTSYIENEADLLNKSLWVSLVSTSFQVYNWCLVRR